MKTFIIAEAGVNHNGDINIAKKLVDVASKAGADAVKFQTFKAENLVCLNAQKANYQLQTTNKYESQYEMLKKLELNEIMHEELIEYCKFNNILFMSSPFDFESIELLNKYGMEVYKIPSGEITNYPYLKKIALLNKKVILSTGMCNLEEVVVAVKVLMDNGAHEISLLHCNTQYPTPMQDVNLRAMQTLRKETGLPVGYSDHTEGIEIPIAAVAMGACIIEKHITLSRDMEGPDHKASIEPSELFQMVKAIRNVEKAMGNGEKVISGSEKNNINIARKSIVASRKIQLGEVLSTENMTTKRPGTGISPMRWNEIIGLRAVKSFSKDEQIQL